MAEAQFFRAQGLKEACDLLSQYGARARILAGGTDLMVAVNRRLLSPEVLIFIGDGDLKYIKAQGEDLVIGAAACHTEIARSPLVQGKAPLLAAAVSSIGSSAIRNVGTIGGNLVTASPAADSAVALLALGGKVKLVSSGGERAVAVDAFFTGPGATVVKPNELLQEAVIPSQKGTKWGWRKLGQRKADICSIVSVAASLHLQNGTCTGARIALGAVAPMPFLAKGAAALLAGKRLDASLIEKVAGAAAEEISPINDVRATAWYRRRAARALVKEVLERIAG